jgi:hypothetical protein
MGHGLHAVSTRFCLSGCNLTSMTYRTLSTQPFKLCGVPVFRRGAGHSLCTWEAEQSRAVTRSGITLVATIPIKLNYRAGRWCSERVRGGNSAPMLLYIAGIENGRFACFCSGMIFQTPLIDEGSRPRLRTTRGGHSASSARTIAHGRRPLDALIRRRQGRAHRA